MSPWRRFSKARRAKDRDDPHFDQTVATLTARADLILEELDSVVKQMSSMLLDNLEEK